MKHPSKQQLSSYLKGAGSKEFRQAVDRHLQRCTICSKLESELRGPVHVESHVDGASNVTTRHASSTPTPIPTQLQNHKLYEVIRLIGAGGMGRVYLVRNRLTGRQEVIKVIADDLVAREDVRQRFLHEIQAAARLDHENIVRTLTAFEEDQLLGLVMEYAKGEDLDALIRRNGALPFQQACAYMLEACRGLQYAMSKGTVHRDIKPANLFIVKNGTSEQLKIMDFGLAKGTTRSVPETEGLTQHGSIVGTPEYMAPEQATSASSADIRSDIYSLGCVFYAALVGRPPFREGSAVATLSAHLTKPPIPPSKLDRAIPSSLDEIVCKMLAKTPADRYQTPSDVAAAIENFVESTSAIAQLRNALNKVSVRQVKQPSEARQQPVAPRENLARPVLVPSRPISRTRGKKGKDPSFVSHLLFVLAPLVLVVPAFLVYREQLTELVKSAAGIKTATYIILKDVPEGVDILIDGRPAAFQRATASSSPRIVAEPGTYTLSVVLKGQTLFKETVTVEDGRDVEISIGKIRRTSPSEGQVRGTDRNSGILPKAGINNRSEQLKPGDVAQRISDAKASLLQRDGGNALVALAPLRELELPSSDLVERLCTAAESLPLLSSSIESAIAANLKRPFFLGGQCKELELTEVLRTSLAVRVGDQTRTYQRDRLPVFLEQTLATLGGLSQHPSGALARSIGLLTNNDFELLEALKLRPYVDRAALEQLAKDLDRELPPELRYENNERFSSSHKLDVSLKPQEGVADRLFLFRQGLVFGGQQSLLATYLQPATGVANSVVWDINVGTDVPFAAKDVRVRDCLTSSNGRIFVTSEFSRDNTTVKVYVPPATKPFSSTVIRSPADLTAIDLSTDGRVLTICGVDEVVTKSNLQARKLLSTTKARTPVGASDVCAISINDSASLIACASKDGMIRIWQVTTGEESARVQSGAQIQHLQFSKDGSKLIVVQSPGLFETYEMPALDAKQEFWGHNSPLAALSVSSNKKFLATADQEGIVRVWDVDTMDTLHAIAESSESPITSVAYETLTEAIAVGFENGSANVWKPATESLPND